jgi:hypothetical protein
MIKQAEQVTTCSIGSRRGALPRFEHSDHRGGRDLRISHVAIIDLADISLQKTAKTARAICLREGGSPAMLPAPPGGSTNRATRAAEPLLCQIQ